MATTYDGRRDSSALLRGGAELQREERTAAVYPDGAVPPAVFAQVRQSRRRRRRGAPGFVAPSRSSDDIRERKDPPLSPVGASTFSSIASAFDFHHHVGSDPASELLVLKRILNRERLLSRLEVVCNGIRKRRRPLTEEFGHDSQQMGEENNGVVKLLSSIRDATITVVEAVAAWREGTVGHPPSAFVWHGENYLLKITNDLNFLAGVEPLVDALKMHPARFCRNPLMLPQTLDDLRRDGEVRAAGVDMTTPAMRKKSHLYQAAQILLDEENFEGERDCLRREIRASSSDLSNRARGSKHGNQGRRDRPRAGAAFVGTSNNAGGTHDMAEHIDDGSHLYSRIGSSSCGIDSVDQYDARRRQHQLSTWYEDARSQMVSLSSSAADEEYFLQSRRFWSKEELQTAGYYGAQQPFVPHRRPPSKLGRSGKCVASGLGRSSSAGFLDEQSGTRKGDYRGPTDPAWSKTEVGVGRRGSLVKEPVNDPLVRAAVTRHGGGLSSHDSKRLQDLRAGILGRTEKTGGEGAENGTRQDRGGAEVWTCSEKGDDPCRGDGGSAALACLTTGDVERLLIEDDPPPATRAVCAAILFLLAPDDHIPEDTRWPQGFEGVAIPAENFLRRLGDVSGRTATSLKARMLKFGLQRDDMLPTLMEQQGAHAVASMCAWALEELQGCAEFAEWSQTALEPWYEMQLNPARCGIPKSVEAREAESTLVYKSLHKFPNIGRSYVTSLFEEGDGRGVTVRAFDRGKRATFWLSLSRKKLETLGPATAYSPAYLALALARRLRIKSDIATGSEWLILPPVKSLECEKRRKRKARKRARQERTVNDDADIGAKAAKEKAVGRPPVLSAPPSVSSSATNASTLCLPPHDAPHEPRSPYTRGLMTDDFGTPAERDIENENSPEGVAENTCSGETALGEERMPSDVVDAEPGERRAVGRRTAGGQTLPAVNIGTTAVVDSQGIEDREGNIAVCESVASRPAESPPTVAEADAEGKACNFDRTRVSGGSEAMEHEEGSYADDFGDDDPDESSGDVPEKVKSSGTKRTTAESDERGDVVESDRLSSSTGVGTDAMGSKEDVDAAVDTCPTIDNVEENATVLSVHEANLDGAEVAATHEKFVTEKGRNCSLDNSAEEDESVKTQKRSAIVGQIGSSEADDYEYGSDHTEYDSGIDGLESQTTSRTSGHAVAPPLVVNDSSDVDCGMDDDADEQAVASILCNSFSDSTAVPGKEVTGSEQATPLEKHDGPSQEGAQNKSGLTGETTTNDCDDYSVEDEFEAGFERPVPSEEDIFEVQDDDDALTEVIDEPSTPSTSEAPPLPTTLSGLTSTETAVTVAGSESVEDYRSEFEGAAVEDFEQDVEKDAQGEMMQLTCSGFVDDHKVSPPNAEWHCLNPGEVVGVDAPVKEDSDLPGTRGSAVYSSLKSGDVLTEDLNMCPGAAGSGDSADAEVSRTVSYPSRQYCEVDDVDPVDAVVIQPLRCDTSNEEATLSDAAATKAPIDLVVDPRPGTSNIQTESSREGVGVEAAGTTVRDSELKAISGKNETFSDPPEESIRFSGGVADEEVEALKAGAAVDEKISGDVRPSEIESIHTGVVEEPRKQLAAVELPDLPFEAHVESTQARDVIPEGNGEAVSDIVTQYGLNSNTQNNHHAAVEKGVAPCTTQQESARNGTDERSSAEVGQGGEVGAEVTPAGIISFEENLEAELESLAGIIDGTRASEQQIRDTPLARPRTSGAGNDGSCSTSRDSPRNGGDMIAPGLPSNAHVSTSEVHPASDLSESNPDPAAEGSADGDIDVETEITQRQDAPSDGRYSPARQFLKLSDKWGDNHDGVHKAGAETTQNMGPGPRITNKSEDSSRGKDDDKHGGSTSGSTYSSGPPPTEVELATTEPGIAVMTARSSDEIDPSKFDHESVPGLEAEAEVEGNLTVFSPTSRVPSERHSKSATSTEKYDQSCIGTTVQGGHSGGKDSLTISKTRGASLSNVEDTSNKIREDNSDSRDQDHESISGERDRSEHSTRSRGSQSRSDGEDRNLSHADPDGAPTQGTEDTYEGGNQQGANPLSVRRQQSLRENGDVVQNSSVATAATGTRGSGDLTKATPVDLKVSDGEQDSGEGGGTTLRGDTLTDAATASMELIAPSTSRKVEEDAPGQLQRNSDGRESGLAGPVGVDGDAASTERSSIWEVGASSMEEDDFEDDFEDEIEKEASVESRKQSYDDVRRDTNGGAEVGSGVVSARRSSRRMVSAADKSVGFTKGDSSIPDVGRRDTNPGGQIEEEVSGEKRIVEEAGDKLRRTSLEDACVVTSDEFGDDFEDDREDL